MRSVSLAIGLVILLVAALSYAALGDNDDPHYDRSQRLDQR